jgi:hypothetical protein
MIVAVLVASTVGEIALNESSPHLEYFYGDEVKIRLSFTHHDDIFAVEAVYAHSEDRTYTLTLEGNPELEGSSPGHGPGKRSTVILSGTFGESHIPGIYGAERVLFHTIAGSTFHYGGTIRLGNWRTLELHGPAHNVSEVEVEFDFRGD